MGYSQQAPEIPDKQEITVAQTNVGEEKGNEEG